MTGPDGSATPGAQIAAVTEAAGEIAALVAAGHEVVLTHGNGPQVGNLLVKNELAAAVVPPVPLDWCGAQTQGDARLHPARRARARAAGGGQRRAPRRAGQPHPRRHRRPRLRGAVQADRAAPAGRGGSLLVDHGETWEDRGEKGWRRVVASPQPLEVLEGPAIRALLDAGLMVIAGGGGGIPVVREADGGLRGVEAVIDKDLSAVVLARAVGAQALVVATDVENAVVGYGTPDARPIGATTPAGLRALAAEGHFASGSMGPKVDAVCRFVEGGGALAVITSLARIDDALSGEAGTVVPSRPALIVRPRSPDRRSKPCPQPSRSARSPSSACPTPPASHS